MMFRTERMEIRLSEDDQALLDKQRGDRSRSAYIRDLIHGDTTVVSDVNVVNVTIDRDGEEVETATEKRSSPSSGTADSPAHRHKRNTLLGRWSTRGSTHEKWRCNCGHIIET